MRFYWLEFHLAALENMPSRRKNRSDLSDDHFDCGALYELTRAISACGNTSVGPDDVHYEFFRHLSKNALTALLAAINDLFVKHDFPATWQEISSCQFQNPTRTKAPSELPSNITD